MQKLPFTSIHKILEGLSLLLLILTGLYLINCYPSLPAQIPIHFTWEGEADAWGDKFMIIWLFLFCFGIYILLTVVNLFPDSWNMPSGITDRNRAAVYGYMRSMLLWIKLFLCGFFGWLLFNVGSQNALPRWFPIILFSLILGTVFYFEFRIYKEKKKKDPENPF